MNQSANAGTGPAWEPADIASLWKALSTEPGTGVTVLMLDGRILYANDDIARIVAGPDARGAHYVGKNLADLFPRPWAEERLRLIADVVTSGEPIVVRAIWNGVQGLSWWSRIRGRRIGGQSGDHVLIITRPAAGITDPARLGGVKLVEAGAVSLGPLSALTARELEVLALLGQGLSIQEMADCLTRSCKTVSRHRDSIGRKLGQSDRLKIAEMAWHAGLTVRDAHRERL